MISKGRCVFLPYSYNRVLDYTITQCARILMEREHSLPMGEMRVQISPGALRSFNAIYNILHIIPYLSASLWHDDII